MSQNKVEFMAGEKVELNCSTDLSFTLLEWLNADGKSLANSSSSFLSYSFNINKPEQLTCRTGTGSDSQNMTLTLRLKVGGNVDDSDSLGVIAGGAAVVVIAIVIVVVLIVVIIVAIGRRFVLIECNATDCP